MLSPRVVQFRPHRTTTADAVIAELEKVMAGANPNFRFQCPSADIDALLAGVLPEEIRMFVEDPNPRSGPQLDRNFITEYRTDIFRDVIVSDVWAVAPFPDGNGIRFSDYSLVVLTESGIKAVARNSTGRVRHV
ncbi:MAG: hypothetical protein U0936_17350 [Planctomycetaceae bacterium]